MKSPSLFALSVLTAPLIAGGAVRFNDPDRPQPASGLVRDTVGCLDTLHATDSVTADIKMTVKPQDSKAKLPDAF